MEEEEEASLHVVVFPWLAMGHLVPFLHLSKCLASRGHRISFISTPRNLARLPKVPSKLLPLLHLVSLTLPHVDGLPDKAESSMDIRPQQAQLLKIAFDLLKPLLATLLQTLSPKPDWIVYDYASHWLPPIAAELGISHAFFSLFTAATMAFFGPPSSSSSLSSTMVNTRTTPEDFTVVPAWVPFKSDVVYRLHEVKTFVEVSSGKTKNSGVSDIERFAVSVGESDVVLFRSCAEFEPEWFDLIHELYQKKPVVSVGFLPPSVTGQEEKDDDGDERWIEIKGWLDEKRANSVVYVALGSEATLSRDELGRLALGLEQSELPFFWALRKPPESDQEAVEMLPEGFLERVTAENRGRVYVEWAPQVKILGHAAVGGFLTHCGWNSVIEGLSFGRVLILFPVMNDQGLNARLLEGKKLGLEIRREGEDGWFSSELVAETVRKAVVSEAGESLRVKSARVGAPLFGDKEVNRSHVDRFVRFLVEWRERG
ncbi:UDP-glycosyltransferase 91C1 [Diospyros lotus]|uniref:UDP-glycosyltransferase 91C1 n=1 Tax=Diospyros lotus TaxID=55363 RepID=UPI0022561C34|nr:UDP-glycosyltransferase 91C1 [Diospyros lotus]